jgi:hypothetical protein
MTTIATAIMIKDIPTCLIYFIKEDLLGYISCTVEVNLVRLFT